MEFKEFSEYTNPEELDYDFRNISDSYDNSVQSQNCYEQLLELIGILEDITDEELEENYGITIQEYLHPTTETIEKVTKKLNEIEKGTSR